MIESTDTTYTDAQWDRAAARIEEDLHRIYLENEVTVIVDRERMQLTLTRDYPNISIPINVEDLLDLQIALHKAAVWLSAQRAEP